MRVDPAPPAASRRAPEGAPLTQMGWEIHPEGLYAAIADARRRSGLPVMVTENGIATADDAQRIDYLRAHLAQVKRALDDGIDVRGYLYWSAFDNFEWNEGYRPQFGLIGIDREHELRADRARARMRSASSLAAAADFSAVEPGSGVEDSSEEAGDGRPAGHRTSSTT